MKKPLVSVIIPFYNEEKYIKNAVMSIVNQTYKNLEILLIDDGSTDNSISIIKDIKDERIRIIECKKNIGRPAARNFGIGESKGEFIAMMDADDECDVTRIEKQINTILQTGINTVCGTSILINTINKKIKKILPTNHDEIIKGFERKINRVTFVAGTIMCKTDLLRQYKYRVKFKYFEDWDLLLRLYESGAVKFSNVAEPLYTYLIRTKSSRNEADWYDYNIFTRNCQSRRKRGLKEFETVEEFKNFIAADFIKSFYYKSLKKMIYLKRIFQNY